MKTSKTHEPLFPLSSDTLQVTLVHPSGNCVEFPAEHDTSPIIPELSHAFGNGHDIFLVVALSYMGADWLGGHERIGASLSTKGNK